MLTLGSLYTSAGKSITCGVALVFKRAHANEPLGWSWQHDSPLPPALPRATVTPHVLFAKHTPSLPGIRPLSRLHTSIFPPSHSRSLSRLTVSRLLRFSLLVSCFRDFKLIPALMFFFSSQEIFRNVFTVKGSAVNTSLWTPSAHWHVLGAMHLPQGFVFSLMKMNFHCGSSGLFRTNGGRFSVPLFLSVNPYMLSTRWNLYEISQFGKSDIHFAEISTRGPKRSNRCLLSCTWFFSLSHHPTAAKGLCFLFFSSFFEDQRYQIAEFAPHHGTMSEWVVTSSRAFDGPNHHPSFSCGFCWQRFKDRRWHMH